MQVKFTTRDMQRAIKELQPAIRANAILPIIEYVHIQVKDNIAHMRATNLDLQIIYQCPCEGENGVFLLPFADMSKSLPAIDTDDFTLTVSDIITATWNGQQLEFPTEPHENFPVLRSLGETHEIPVTDEFIVAIKEAVKHQNPSETTPMLNGFCIGFNGDEMHICGTDANICYLRILKGGGSGVLHVPESFAIAANEGHTLRIDDKHIELIAQDKTVSALLLEQKFVPYHIIFARTIEPNLHFSLKELLPKLSLVIAYGDFRVDLQLSATKMDISYENSNYKRAYSGSIACNYTGDTTSVSYNAALFKQILQSMQTDAIAMEIISEKKPAYMINGNIKSIVSPLVQK